MNSVDPKQAKIFIAVLAVIAIVLNWTYAALRQGARPIPVRQPATAYQPGYSQPQRQPQIESQRETASRRTEDVRSAERSERMAELAAEKARADAAAEQARYLSAKQASEKAAAARAEYLARYLSALPAQRPGARTAAVVVASEEKKLNRRVGDALAARFAGGEFEISTSFLRSDFVSDGLLAQVLSGAGDVLRKLELAESLEVLVLAQQEVRYTSDPSLENVITASMQLNVMVLPVRSDGESLTWTFKASGAGFKEGEARAMAEERLIKQIAGNTNMSLSRISSDGR